MRWGVLSSIVLGAWESHVQGEGLDGSTQPAKETCAGHCWIGETQANLTAGNSNEGEDQQATPVSGSVWMPER